LLGEKLSVVQIRNKVSAFEILESNAGRISLIFSKVGETFKKHTLMSAFGGFVEQTRLSKIKKAR
jgi:hypothetical protein